MKKQILFILALASGPALAWNFDEYVDDFDDSNVFYAAYERGALSYQWNEDGPGWMHVACNPRRDERYRVHVSVNMDTVLGSIDESRQLLYRAGTGTSSGVQAVITGDDQSRLLVIGEDALHIVGEMIDADDRLGFLELSDKKSLAVFASEDWRGVRHKVHIPVRRASKVLPRVLKACGLNRDGTAYVSPTEGKRKAADRIGKALDDTGAAQPAARPAEAPAPKPQSEAPQPSGTNPLRSVTDFVGDTAGLLTGDIEIKEGGSNSVRPGH